jgi:hypothetical protein
MREKTFQSWHHGSHISNVYGPGKLRPVHDNSIISNQFGHTQDDIKTSAPTSQ